MAGSKAQARRRAGVAGDGRAESAEDGPVGRAAQLGYIAQMAATSDGCDCRACEALREQASVFLDDYSKGRKTGAPGDDPQP